MGRIYLTFNPHHASRPSQETRIPYGPDGTPSIKMEREIAKTEREMARIREEQEEARKLAASSHYYHSDGSDSQGLDAFY
jgi:hypothetical protein